MDIIIINKPPDNIIHMLVTIVITIAPNNYDHYH